MATEQPTGAPFASIPDRIDRQASLRPDALAIDAGASGGVTYAELSRRASETAARLRQLGAGPGTLVAVCLERTPDLISALLGVLKSGAAYLPLDPEYPAERLQFMLRDSGARIAITDQALAGRLPEGVRGIRPPAIEADSRPAVTSGEPTVESSTIYVIYTSGSTGAPKAVEITHGAVCNLLDSFAETPGLRPDERVLALTTLSFDIAVIEIWLPLVRGATVVLVDRQTGRDGFALRERIASGHPTYIQATPSTWRLLLDAGWRDGRGVTAISGGEPLTPALAAALLDTGVDLWNAYGPTETTVWSSLAHVTSVDATVPIGRPIANTELVVLDGERRAVPSGDVGELHIGGTGLAKGYLHRPQLTAERFVTDPRDSSRRLYRTGDLARRRPDGQFECLGRIDHQIKIDGYRIEPGEIEAALGKVPGVGQSVVACRERADGDKQLVAYYVPTGNVFPDAPEIRRALADSLPAHMIPAMFVRLHHLPLTPNGKVDRTALPAPQWGQRHVRAAVPARTPVEARLVRLFSEVLDAGDVGVHDNFFDLGGRSRLGARLFARIEAETGVRLPLAALFESPTVEALAARLTADQPGRRWPSLVAIRRTGSLTPFFCVHPVGGNVVSFGPLAEHLGPDVPFYGLQAVGLDGVAAPLPSVEAMAVTYLDDIRRVDPHGPYALGGASFGGLVAFEMARQLEAAGARVALLALFDTEFPPVLAPDVAIPLSSQPVFRRHVYPLLVRARAHGRSLRRLGPSAYLQALRRPDRHEAPGVAKATTADPFTRVLADVERANRRAAESYVPGRYRGTATFFRALEEGGQPDRAVLWERVARVVTLDVPGTHYTMRQEPHVGVLARRLREALTEVQQTTAAA